MGRTVFLTRTAIHRLPILWLIMVGLIPQEYRCPRLIYDYMWSGLNVAVLR